MEEFTSEYRHPVLYEKTSMVALLDGEKNWRYVYSFYMIHERDRQTDGRTDTAWQHRPRLCIASRGKNLPLNKHKLVLNHTQALSYSNNTSLYSVNTRVP